MSQKIKQDLDAREIVNNRRYERQFFLNQCNFNHGPSMLATNQDSENNINRFFPKLQTKRFNINTLPRLRQQKK